MLDVARVLALHWSGLLPFVPFRGGRAPWLFAVTIPDEKQKQRAAAGGKLPFEAHVASLPPAVRPVLRVLLGSLFGERGVLYDPSLPALLRRRGVPTWCLGVSSDRDLPRFRRCHVSAALTDDPEWLVKHVEDGAFARL